MENPILSVIGIGYKYIFWNTLIATILGTFCSRYWE